MLEKSSFLKKGDVAELRESARLIFDKADIQSQIESGIMPPEDQKLIITGRAAHEANIYIARQIVQPLQAKTKTWKKLIDDLPKEDAARS